MYDIIIIVSLWFQNGPITSWPSQRQVLVPSWQQLPNVASARPVQQPMVTTDALASHDTWRRSLMVENFDQGSSIIPMVGFDSEIKSRRFKVCSKNPRLLDLTWLLLLLLLLVLLKVYTHWDFSDINPCRQYFIYLL